nr:hypothetical protein [Tanacetum cinerariifolium]
MNTSRVAILLLESPLEVEPLNMVELFAGSPINDWRGTLYAVGGVPVSNMITDVPVGNMPDDGFVPNLSLGLGIVGLEPATIRADPLHHIKGARLCMRLVLQNVPAINTDVLPSYGRATQEEIILNLGLTLWSENQALIGANEELHALVREMRKR